MKKIVVGGQIDKEEVKAFKEELESVKQQLSEQTRA